MDREDGKWDDAINNAKKGLESDEDKAVALKVLVEAYNKKGDKDKAKEYQAQLDILEPDSPESLYNKAVPFINQRDDAQARPLLEKAIQIKPDFAEAWYGLGVIPRSPLAGGLLAGAAAKAKGGRRAGEWAQKDLPRYRAQLDAYEGLCSELGEPPADVALPGCCGTDGCGPDHWAAHDRAAAGFVAGAGDAIE
jgi:predicted Zn-dependent protease